MESILRPLAGVALLVLIVLITWYIIRHGDTSKMGRGCGGDCSSCSACPSGRLYGKKQEPEDN